MKWVGPLCGCAYDWMMKWVVMDELEWSGKIVGMEVGKMYLHEILPQVPRPPHQRMDAASSGHR